MKNLKFVIILFLLVVILFSLFNYVSDEQNIEGLNGYWIDQISEIAYEGRYYDYEKVSLIRNLPKLAKDDTIKKIINKKNITDEEKVGEIKIYLPTIPRTK